MRLVVRIQVEKKALYIKVHFFPLRNEGRDSMKALWASIEKMLFTLIRNAESSILYSQKLRV